MTVPCKPTVKPFADVVDGWVVVCDCGLTVTYADKRDAVEHRDQHQRGEDDAS